MPRLQKTGDAGNIERAADLKLNAIILTVKSLNWLLRHCPEATHLPCFICSISVHGYVGVWWVLL